MCFLTICRFFVAWAVFVAFCAATQGQTLVFVPKGSKLKKQASVEATHPTPAHHVFGSILLEAIGTRLGADKTRQPNVDYKLFHSRTDLYRHAVKNKGKERYVAVDILAVKGPLAFGPRLKQGIVLGLSAGLSSAALLAISFSAAGRVAKLAQGSKFLRSMQAANKATHAAKATHISLSSLMSAKSLFLHLVPTGALVGTLHALGDGLAWWHTDAIYNVGFLVSTQQDPAEITDIVHAVGSCVVFVNFESDFMEYEVGHCFSPDKFIKDQLLPRREPRGHLRSPNSQLEFIDDYYEHNMILHKGRVFIPDLP